MVKSTSCNWPLLFLFHFLVVLYLLFGLQWDDPIWNKSLWVNLQMVPVASSLFMWSSDIWQGPVLLLPSHFLGPVVSLLCTSELELRSWYVSIRACAPPREVSASWEKCSIPSVVWRGSVYTVIYCGYTTRICRATDHQLLSFVVYHIHQKDLFQPFGVLFPVFRAQLKGLNLTNNHAGCHLWILPSSSLFCNHSLHWVWFQYYIYGHLHLFAHSYMAIINFAIYNLPNIISACPVCFFLCFSVGESVREEVEPPFCWHFTPSLSTPFSTP